MGSLRDLGAREPPHGEVIAVFDKSLYVETRSGIACIGAELGGGPLNARCSAPLAGVAVGDAVACTAGHVVVGTARLATRGAIDWRPPEPRFVPRLDEIAAAEPGGGLSRLAQALARGETFEPGDDPLLRKVSQGAAALVAADFDNAEPLLGLGPGLTPSGDDFIGGYLVALHALGRRHEAEAIAARLLPLAPPARAGSALRISPRRRKARRAPSSTAPSPAATRARSSRSATAPAGTCSPAR